jgi:hypothetical protein
MLSDGFTTLIDGMNEGVDKDRLPATQYVRGVNVKNRKGVLGTRDCWEKIAGMDSAAMTGIFQGAFRYRRHDDDRIVWVISGTIWSMRLSDFSLVNVSALNGVSMAVDKRCYFCKAEKYCIIQDGVSPAVIMGETGPTSARIAVAANNEVPTGTIMAFGHNRLFVVPDEVNGEDGRRFFLAGDLARPNNVGHLLGFTDTTYLDGGGAMSLPQESGFIGGMIIQKNVDTGDGYGPLIVGSQDAFAAFAIDQPRASDAVLGIAGWDDIDIRRVLFGNAGLGSPFSIVTINSDVWFRGYDGLRSLAVTIAENAQSLRNEPMSGEMQDIFALDDDLSLAAVSMAYADSRLFCTAVPSTERTKFKGLAVLDFAPVQNVKQNVSPSFDGVYTGALFLQLVTARYQGHDRLFAFVQNEQGTMDICWLNPAAETDPNGALPECRVYTRRMDCGYPRNLKTLKNAIVWASDIRGDCTLEVYVRPDNYPFWAKMGATVEISAPVAGGGFSQERPAMRFAADAPICDPINHGNGYRGYGFQLCLIWTGRMNIKQCVLDVDVATEPTSGACEVAGDGDTLTATRQIELEPTDYDYRW